MEIINTLKGEHIKELLKNNRRIDTRAFMEMRHVKVKRGVLPQAEGSAQVDLGTTKVLVGIKLMPDDPMPDTPNQGNLITSAELLPLAHPEYETGPPSRESIELARVVDRGIRAGNCIDLESLVLEDKKVWSVYIDLYILNFGGNLFDASTMAAMAALLDTKIPKYENGIVVREERVKSLKIDNIVSSTTFGKIDNYMLLDMNDNEEGMADARVTICTDGTSIRAMQKGLSGSFKPEEIGSLIDVSLNEHEKIKRILEK